jgi:NADH dehydrogenase
LAVRPRPTTDATGLQDDGIEVIRGDLRDPASLDAAMAGVDTVVTTANAIGRLLAGAKDLTISAVDGEGNKHLIRAAARAVVGRFILVSTAGLIEELARLSPLMAAKWAAERALWSTSMQIVLVRPDMFQEVRLAPMTGIDPAAGKALIYGRGELPHRYVAIDDVARLCAHLAVVADPPQVVEAATGKALKVRHVPDAAMSIGHLALARIKPEVASRMGMALFSDTHPGTWDDRPLREAGIEPRPATAFIRSATSARV